MAGNFESNGMAPILSRIVHQTKLVDTGDSNLEKPANRTIQSTNDFKMPDAASTMSNSYLTRLDPNFST